MTQSNVYESTPNNLEAFWMPFTANRQFKSKPRLFTGAKDMHYTTVEGRKVLDGTAGPLVRQCRPWPARDHGSGARSGRPPRLCAGLPDGPSRGLRIRRAPHQSAGGRISTMSSSPIPDRNRSIPPSRWPSPITASAARARAPRLIGRERGYHGVGFGGISVGGIVANRKSFGSLLNGVDHLPHTHNLAKNAFSRGQPD